LLSFGRDIYQRNNWLCLFSIAPLDTEGALLQPLKIKLNNAKTMSLFILLVPFCHEDNKH